MVLFLHNRYRASGGEERVVEDLVWLVREHLEEPAELLARDSATLGSARAAVGLLRGGLAPSEVAKAVRLAGARVVHAHNLNPSFGWRSLAAAKAQGARVVAHLHQYRMVCAIGVCYTRGAECTRCHGRNTWPGVRLNCRGSSSEALLYGAGLALWQHKLLEQADALISPSLFALERLRELGLELAPGRAHVIPPPIRQFETRSSAAAGAHALVVSRLAPEKGIEVAIDACQAAGRPLLIVGDGPDRARLMAHAARASGASSKLVSFAGRLEGVELADARASAAIALSPSRSAETFGLAAAEAMACGLPVIASRVGALGELLGEESLVEPGDQSALAAAIERLWGDEEAGERNLARVRELCSPQSVASMLRTVYDATVPPTSA
jgi:glycosyltransferase involved in cell wall biosynthesis